MFNEIDLEHVEHQRQYLEFLDDVDDEGVYNRRVKDMIAQNKVRLLVNFADLRKKLPERADSLFVDAADEQVAFQNALKQYVTSLEPDYKHHEFYIGYEGSFGDAHVTPRFLTSKYINTIVCLEGIVTQCSIVRPKLMRSVHYCPTTKKMSEKHYSDFTSLKPLTTVTMYPTQDIDGNLLETEFGLSSYKDHQSLTIQEMPEKAPAGQLPRSVEVLCEHDLADRCKPGDRVQIIGIFRCLPAKKNNYTTAMFRTVLLANNITILTKDTQINMTRVDVANCRRLAKTDDIFEVFSNSLAPSIHGHEYVKKAILCMLLGGVEKVLENGTRLRGDINILLIGDPGVAKSQLLRYVLGTAPRAVATTGRGSSGVGLTAAVTTDHETGEKKLVAGAMVLADRGIVCIDEFDKMSDIDRTAIHEVMEQGRITIAKAGIHVQLNARCSVLAAANPIYGKYDQYKPPMANIGLQDSLLSRFDLMFIMLDIVNDETDKIISDHVVRMHRYRNPDEPDGAILPMTSNVDILCTFEPINPSGEDESVPIYEKHDELLHGGIRSKLDQVFTIDFMRMYISIAKSLKPDLTQEALDLITEEYVRLRSKDAIQPGSARTQPVTVRTLETMIRLATAHAKVRLASEVEAGDAEAAIELVQYAYFKKVLAKDKKKRRRSQNATTSDDDDDDDDADGGKDETPKGNNQKRKKPRASGGAAATSDGASVEPQPSSSAAAKPEVITLPRLGVFKLLVSKVFQESGTHTLERSVLIQKVNELMDTKKYTELEIEAAFITMCKENQVMVHDDIIILI